MSRASSPPQHRIYIDTNTFVYELMNTSHWCHPKAKKFFGEITKQKFIGATSSFVRTEFLSVIKTLLATQQKSSATASSIQQAMDSFDRFIGQMGIEYYDSDNLVGSGGTFFADSQKRVEGSTSMKGNDGKWRTLNGADSLHLIFAERSQSHEIATSDQGYKTMVSSVTAHIIWEKY